MKYIKKQYRLKLFSTKAILLKMENIVFLNGQLKRMKMACFIIKMKEIYISIRLKVK